ncbi:hypothetical protein AAFN85_02955 [Mucilaginibacter sp. CAU 1740]|uniref:hypothetical protein n=1 Tax=Mucilaginibacter sp. CAU 1740 TaxID=3140365 RepID=UPI00325BE818
MDQSPSIIDIITENIKNPLRVEIFPIDQVAAHISTLFVEDYGLAVAVADKIVAKHLVDYFKTLKENLYVLVERKYVDKMYRDAYYHYYSSKLNPYYRDCIRLSFFDTEMVTDDFKRFDATGIETLKSRISEHYLGFLVLRPTFPRIIGRNALSPRAIINDNIECCLAKIAATVYAVKQKVLAFPHASQDHQTMTCAETTVWSILEYFGNKYPEYKPVLLSTINQTLHKFSYKRLLPSDGLTAEQITYAIRDFGFGAMIYSREEQEKVSYDFNSIISTYVESGIPVIAVLENEELGHAVNIIGRTKHSPGSVTGTEPHVTLSNGLAVIDFNKIERKYVLIDDNQPPYQLAKLDKPCEDYITDERWHSCDITNIIVPLYHRIYLDAVVATKNFYNAFRNSIIGVNDGEKRVARIFLASTRTYKQYVAMNETLNILVKEMILALPMPKFIWVAEVSKLDSYEKGDCDELYIQDATEPYKNSDVLSNLSFLACYTDGTFFVQNFGKFERVRTFAHPFQQFKENLN